MFGSASRRARRKSSVGPAISKRKTRSYTPSAADGGGAGRCAPRMHEVPVHRFHLRGELLARVHPTHPLRRRGPETTRELTVLEQAPHGPGERRRVGVGDEQPIG